MTLVQLYFYFYSHTIYENQEYKKQDNNVAALLTTTFTIQNKLHKLKLHTCLIMIYLLSETKKKNDIIIAFNLFYRILLYYVRNQHLVHPLI
jgi:hypothetical protein